MFARAPSRSFRRSRIGCGCFARPSSALWLDPRSRSHLIGEQLEDAPDVIGESRSHRWCAGVPEVLAVAQFMMRPAPIVGTPNHIHPHLKGFAALRGMAAFAGQRGQTFAHGPIEAFNQGGIEFHTAFGLGKEPCACAGSQGELAGDFHHPFLFLCLTTVAIQAPATLLDTHLPRPAVFFTFSRKARIMLFGYAQPSVQTRSARRLTTRANLVE